MNQDFDSFGVGPNRQIQDPFLLPSSQSMPLHMGNFLEFSKFLYYLNPKYRQASRRLVRYFITDFEFPKDVNTEQNETRREFLTQQLKLQLFLGEFGDDGQAYGQAYAWIYFPFDRYVWVDKKWIALSAIPEDKIRFDLASLKYSITKPAGGTQLCKFIDFPSKDPSRICLRKLDPRYVYVRNHILSGRRDVIWRIPEKDRRLVREGNLFAVNDFPKEMLQCIRDEQDFLFAPQEVYVFTNPTLSGVSDYGIGLPEVIANFRSIFQVQVYRKMDESIGLDYMLPFRVFTPNLGTSVSANDINQFVASSDWSNQIGKMIAARRKDQFSMHSAPFPVNMQEFGSSGKSLSAKENLEFCTEDMLDSLGYPVEFFRSSLQMMQMPTAMRMFESSFGYLAQSLQGLTIWVNQRVERYLGWDKLKVILQSPKIADKIDLQNLLLNLLAAGKISSATALRSVGISDPQAEMKRVLDEQMEQQRQVQDAQKRFQAEQELGITASPEPGTVAGSSPSAGQAGQVTTPTEVQGQADQLAQQWFSIPDTGQRRIQMQQVQSTNPDLYAIAKARYDKLKYQSGRNGQQQAQAAAAQSGPTQ